MDEAALIFLYKLFIDSGYDRALEIANIIHRLALQNELYRRVTEFLGIRQSPALAYITTCYKEDLRTKTLEQLENETEIILCLRSTAYALLMKYGYSCDEEQVLRTARIILRILHKLAHSRC